jgi:hypothetical protein
MPTLRPALPAPAHASAGAGQYATASLSADVPPAPRLAKSSRPSSCVNITELWMKAWPREKGIGKVAAGI